MKTQLRQLMWQIPMLGALLFLVDSAFGVTPAVTAGQDHTVALKSDGTVWAWGTDGYNQLGDGNWTEQWAPVSSLSGMKAIFARNAFTAMLRSDGTVWTNNWSGSNLSDVAAISLRYVLLNDGTVVDYNGVSVSGLSGVIAIANGGSHALALKSNGTIWAWGSNEFGQLGDGSRIARSTPVRVYGLTGVVAIAAGYGYSVALRSDSSIWTWGFNGDYQPWNMLPCNRLGRGFLSSDPYPGMVTSEGGLGRIVAIAAGGDHTLALKSDGTVLTWGSNGFGQLGRGTRTACSGIEMVGGLNGIVAVGAGAYHSVVLRNDGSVWTWGANAHGQLGDYSGVEHWTPVRVVGPGGEGYLQLGVLLQVSKTGDGHGTVSSTPAGIKCGTDCQEYYANGTLVTLNASAPLGSKFIGWSEACTGTKAKCTVTMSTALAATATFIQVPVYRLIVNKLGAGTVTSSPTGITCGTDCWQDYNSGKVVTLTAKPATGRVFTGWSGACTGTQLTCKVTMTGNLAVGATFKQPPP